MNRREKQGVFDVKGDELKKNTAAAFALVICILSFLACGRERGGPALKDIPGDRPVRSVTDDLGRQVTLPIKVRRVVSTAPSVTENIFAVGAGDRLVGVTTFCNYPEEAKAIAKIGDTMTPNMETIVALQPDIVFVSTASQLESFVDVLERNGIAVFVTDPKSISSVFDNLQRLSELLHTEDVAVGLSTKLRSRESDVRNGLGTCRPEEECDYPDLPTIRVFLQFSREPLFTIGKESYLNEVLAGAGGKSVTADVESAFPKLSKETALALRPEVIILSDSPDNQEPNEAFRNSPAVKNGRVYKINADIISRPGPRLVDALEQIAKLLHPEKFP